MPTFFFYFAQATGKKRKRRWKDADEEAAEEAERNKEVTLADQLAQFYQSEPAKSEPQYGYGQPPASNNSAAASDHSYSAFDSLGSMTAQIWASSG